MATLTTVLTLLSPLGLALLLARALQQAINPSILSKSFVRRQLLYAFFLIPLIDFFARVWLLQPFVPIFAFLAAAVSGAAAALFWVLQKAIVVANKTAILASSLDQVVDFARNEVISPGLKQTLQNTSFAIQDIFSRVNYTQLTTDLLQYSQEVQRMAPNSTLDPILIYGDLWRNITTNPIVMEAGSNLSSIMNNSLHLIHFTDLVRNGDSLQPESLVFQQVKENWILFANRLCLEDASSLESFKEMMSDLSTYSTIALDGMRSLGVSLSLRSQAMVSNSTLPDETKQTFAEILHVLSGKHSVADAFHSMLEAPWPESESAYRMCDAYKYFSISPRWIAAMFIITLMSLPLMYAGRALLQSWIQWHLSKTYREVGNEAERKIDGYMLTGGVTGIGFGAAQVTFHALFWGLGALSTRGKLALLFHGALLMVMNCVIQMGISSAEGRRDLMRRWSGRKGWWMLATMVHVVGGAWWTAQYVGILAFAALGLDMALGAMAVGDAMVIAIFAWWATSILQRARSDEINNSRRE